jgi:hypothetical protein
MVHGKRIIYIYIYTYRKKKEKSHLGYQHNFSPASPGGLRAANGGTRDDREFEAQWVQAQRVSISLLDRSAL